jgi:hypothetical protein
MLSGTIHPGSGERWDLADYINPRSLSERMGVRLDAATAAFFLRDLTGVLAKTYDVKYPDLTARQIIPASTAGVSPGDESWVWRQYDRVGAASLLDNNMYAADEASNEVVAAEFESRIVSIGTSYSYTLMDLRKSAASGTSIPLDTRKAMVARRSMEQAIEQMAYFGVAQVPGTANGQALRFVPAAPNASDPLVIYGLTNFPGLNVTTTTNTWASSSVTTILSDFNAAQLQVVQSSAGVHRPNTAVFPVSTWSLLAATARSPTFTSDSILQFIQTQSPWLKQVFWTPMLETAGLKQNGTTPGPRILLMERNEENFQMIIPQEFEQLPPQMVNYSFKIPCHLRYGGLRVSYPKAFTALDGTAG